MRIVLIILALSSSAFAAAPICKYAAFKTTDKPTPSTISNPLSACIDVLRLYSNYIGVGKTEANGCSDWTWADRLVKNYGRKIQREGLFFDEIPDLDNPLGRPQSSKDHFQLKIFPVTEGYKGEIAVVAEGGQRCALSIEIARPAGVAAPVVAAVAAPAKRKLTAKKTVRRAANTKRKSTGKK
jgi:hypothetical protein